MRSPLLALALLGVTTTAADAAQVTVALGASSLAGTAQTAQRWLPVTPGQTVKVYVFAKTDTFQANPSNTVGTANSGGTGYVDFTTNTVAGGIRGFQFTVATPGTVNGANFNAGSAASAFAISSSDFAQTKPTRNDVDTDTDFDAKAGSFSDSANFTKVDLGTSHSSTLLTSGEFAGYDLIATEIWTVAAAPTSAIPLVPTIIGATYYDSSSPSNWQSDATAAGMGAILGMPEPSCLSLAGLISLGWCRRRRRA